MTPTRTASTCRWAVPTLFLAPPYWFDAEVRSWTCLRHAVPQALDSTVACATCPHWEPRSADDADVVRPMMLDWFGAFRAPHETD